MLLTVDYTFGEIPKGGSIFSRDAKGENHLNKEVYVSHSHRTLGTRDTSNSVLQGICD